MRFLFTLSVERTIIFSYGESELPVYVVVSSNLPLKMSISALGIHYLHSEAPVKVIHRDLKSRNGNRFDF